ncbi:glucose-induced degradation complex subunit GID7 PWA37_002815 [Arxiozyma heterogenica]|uniref:glucose-induced degradation complex subunit GID7 n=1 Tax=Arxiozyma heterogenica TaxID=278026 RepID=UPI002F21B777
MSFNKIQLTKLLIHSLKELGYDETSMTLQRESGGIQIESNLVQNLFQNIRKSYYFDITFKLLSQLPLISNINPSGVTLYQTLSQIGYFANKDETTDAKNHINFSIDNNNNNNDNNHHIMIIDHFHRQYELFKSVSKQLNTIPSDQLPSFVMSLQIMLLVQRQYFIELISISHNFNQSINFLRNIIQKYHSLYQRVFSSISISFNNTIATDQLLMKHPDLFLTSLTEFITNPKLINQLYSTQNSYQDELIKIISNIIDPDELIPTGRLITLLKQSIKYQKLTSGVNIFDDNTSNYNGNSNNNNNNNTSLDYSKYSLLEDNKNFHGKYKFENIKTLSVNNNNNNNNNNRDPNGNEIWYLLFSPDGKYLASSIADSSSDRKISIYDVENDFQIYKILAGNNQYILYLSFSPNSQYLAACPFNENANIYDIHSKGEAVSDVINTSTTISVYNNSHIPLKERVLPEIIYPIDSLKIEYTHKPSTHNHETTSTSSPSSPSSSPSPALNSSPSLSSVSPDPTTTDSHPSKISPRVWCCDWFHTKKHENIIVFGSPDRDVIFYNFNTKKTILRMSQISSYYRSDNQNHKKDYYHGPSRRANSSNTHDDNDDRPNDSERDEENDHNFNIDDSSNIIENANLFPRVHDLKISNDDKYLILMTHNGIIDVYDISSFPNNNLLKRNNNSILEKFLPPRVTQLNIGKNMTCISLPAPTDLNIFERNNDIDNFQHNMSFKLNHLVLINLQFNEIQLWDYKENILIQKFFGQRQEQFIIRSCFGYQNKVVISGSEDGKIYIWDRSNGNILNVLQGHADNNMILNNITTNGTSNTRKKFTKNCNVVAWSPQDKDLFVSGGDDGLIKVWKITYY